MIEWIKRTLSESGSNEPSTKRQVLAFSVILTGGIIVASFVTGKDIPSNSLTLLQTLLSISGISYTISRFSENKEVVNNG